MHHRLTPLLMTLLIPLSTLADSIPTRSAADARVRYVDYKSDDVVVIATALGVVTRIVLGSDEKILRVPDSGFPGACEEPSNEWCIRADVGQNQITIKPRRGATQNNLEVTTDKRDYSFVLHKMDGEEKSKSVFYRVIFRHPMPALPAPHVQMPFPKPLETETESARPKSQPLAKPAVRNVSYSVKSDEKSSSILPSVIFDDGRFTYLKFPKSREIPAVFTVDGNGQEVRVAFHSERLLPDPQHPGDELENDYLVIRRVARAIRLRLGALVAEIINDRYDPEGIETINGTTTPTLRREVKP
jgi:type IV secretion system protein VirB9